MLLKLAGGGGGAFGLGFAIVAVGATGKAGTVGVVETSNGVSTGSPIVIVDGSDVAVLVLGSVNAGDAALALAAGRFGSSLETATTAAAVTRTTNPPRRIIPTRRAKLACLGSCAISGRVRVGPRPARRSCTV
jgi:hypothetical protein